MFKLHSRSLVGRKLDHTSLLDYVSWVDDGFTKFRAFFASGTDQGSIPKLTGEAQIELVRSIGGGLLVEGVDVKANLTDDAHFGCSASPIETELFEGLNTILAIRNGEPPEVLREWLAYHVEHHSVQAVLLVDRAQNPKPLIKALESDDFSFPGLKRIVVLSAPLPLGSKNLPPEAHPFCAPAAPGKDRMIVPDPDPWDSPLGELLIFEIARVRFLEKARAVVAIDIFDLLLPHDESTVFDLAQSVPSGVVPVEGVLAYPWRVKNGEDPKFHDHICVQFDGEKAKRRWCIAPTIAGPKVVWRPTRIVGSQVDPTHVRKFACCLSMRHRSSKVSQIVPKSSLVENARLLELSETYLGGNAIRVPQLQMEKVPDGNDQSVVVITCMKNEGPFILEWLAYHRVIGIENFIVYTNDCDDGTDTFLDLLQAKGYVQHRENPFHGTGLKPQHAALEASSQEEIVKSSAWAISMDVDEFICIHVGDGTLKSLFAAVPDANMISFTWRLFGDAGIVNFKDELLTRSFTRCARKFANKPHQAWGFKTLFRQNGIFKKLGVHRPKGLNPQLIDSLNWVNGSGKPMPEKAFRNAWRSTRDTYGYELVSLNHYAVRSAESFLVKRDRGRVNHVDRDQGMAYWFRMNNNEEEDISIMRMAGRLQAEIERLKSDPDIAEQHNACVKAHRSKIDALRASQNFANFFKEITSERMQRLSRMHRHFGANVFLSGPQVVPDELVFADHEDGFFFTVERQD